MISITECKNGLDDIYPENWEMGTKCHSLIRPQENVQSTAQMLENELMI